VAGAWGARGLVVLVGATAFLFAGSYLSSLVFPGCLCLVLLAMSAPWAESRQRRGLDLALLMSTGIVALQLLPVPAAAIDALSPADRHIRQAMSLAPVTGALPISIDRSATAWALAVFAGAVMVFFVARRIFDGGGVRTVVRGLAGIGLILSAICLAQDATGHGLMYWRWKPPFEVAYPFGPFINRNHYATWVVMTVPVVLGYLQAHGWVHRRDHVPATWRARLGLFDGRSLWLTAAVFLMLVGLVASLSRSGMIAMASALIVAMHGRARHGGARLSGWAVGGLLLAIVAALVRNDALELYHRFAASAVAASDRLSIWRATLPVIKDFWVTGAGAGTFEIVMLVYERTPSLFRINAAHNHYLQVAAEGGLLLVAPVAASLGLFARDAARSLRADGSPSGLMRIGACSGLVGAAVQSVWETGLTTPANALLAAVLAAIVVHRSTGSGQDRGDGATG
jgi:O-antigen ligase